MVRALHREPLLMPIERRRVLYRGRVQGVGFRYTAQRLARGHPVAGFVRNLDDGRVELVAEGEPAAVSTFLVAVARAMGDRIEEAGVESEPIEGGSLQGFTIHH